MNQFIYFLLFSTMAFQARADLTEKVTRDRLMKNLEIETQSFVTSADGGRILESDGAKQGTRFAFQPEKYTSHPRTWSTTIEGLEPVNLVYNIYFTDETAISIDISQYKTIKPEPKDLIRKATLQMKDFGGVSWVAKGSAEKNIVVRFTPLLPTSLEPEELKSPLVALTDVIAVDNANRIWSRGIGGAGEVIALGSSYGRLLFSFRPFPGATEMGFARGDEIQLNLDSKRIVWIRSRESIIGGGVRAKIYGVFQENVKEPAYAQSGMFMTSERAASEVRNSGKR